MKKLLPIQLFLFLLTSLFTVNVFGQPLPDPGNDPIQPVDSIVQTITLKPDGANRKEAMNVPASKPPLQGLANITQYARSYNREEKQKQYLLK